MSLRHRVLDRSKPCPACGAEYELSDRPAEPHDCCCGDRNCPFNSEGGGPVWEIRHTGGQACIDLLLWRATE